MSLRVVGAGLGRTGTLSLKHALDQLLGGTSYHMVEVFNGDHHVDVWQRALDGDEPDWAEFMAPYVACVDWPACTFWEPIAAAHPEAIILLSHRDLDRWFTSADNTIFQTFHQPPDPDNAWEVMARKMLERFCADYLDRDAAIEAHQHHLDHVRATADPDRLVEWTPGDGWGPLCERLGLEVPDEPFPHVNSTEEFRANRDDADTTES